jgi:hypothetical protein
MLRAMPNRTAAALLALVTLLLLSPELAPAQTKPTRTRLAGEPPRAVLWVGNSFFYYNDSMHGHLRELTRGMEPRVALRGTSVTISGSGLDWHDVASYLRGGIGRYSFVGDNQIVFDEPGRQFDTVLMMDCSQCPIHPQLEGTFRETVKKDSAVVVQYGARPALFMSWAYQDRPEMTAQLAEAYTRAGNANDALVVPAGLAFARALAARPGLQLYQPDKRHPSLAGTYLAACTVYASLFGRSPSRSSYTAGLPAELAAFLQATAWEATQAYYAK